MTIFTKNTMTGKLSFNLYNGLCFIAIPLLIVIAVCYTEFTLGKTLNSSIIGILSIFIVLAFQVVFISTDKFVNRVSNKIKENTTQEGLKLYEDERNYVIRIRNCTIQFVRQIVLLLFLSILIILNSFIGLCFSHHIIQVFISALMLSSFYIWLILLIKMIVSIYRLQMDDIDYYYNKICPKG
jgi:hypothetical protein